MCPPRNKPCPLRALRITATCTYHPRRPRIHLAPYLRYTVRKATLMCLRYMRRRVLLHYSLRPPLIDFLSPWFPLRATRPRSPRMGSHPQRGIRLLSLMGGTPTRRTLGRLAKVDSMAVTLTALGCHPPCPERCTSIPPSHGNACNRFSMCYGRAI